MVGKEKYSKLNPYIKFKKQHMVRSREDLASYGKIL